MSTFRDDKRVLSHLHRKLGNAIQAHVVWVVWRWRPYARVTRDGQTWVVKTDKELQDEGVTYSERAIRDAIARLDKLGILTRTRGPHPNRRLSNARFLRIDDTLFDELEEVSRERGSVGAQRRIEADTNAGSKRSEMPYQPGNSRRLYEQETRSKTNNATFNVREERAGPKLADARVEVSEEEAFIQAGFDKGCRERMTPYRAPELDHLTPVRGIRRFWWAMKRRSVTLEDAADVARYFAKTYDVDYIAPILGKRKDQGSPQPNQILLGMCAADALSRWEEQAAWEKKKQSKIEFSFDEDDD